MTHLRAELCRAALRQGVAVEIVAGGTSMRPLLHAGDRLTIEPARAETLRLDDVAVVARADGQVVAHRVVGLAPLRLHGDGCREPDAPVSADAVLGRVVRFRRGPATIRLDQPLGRLLSQLSRRVAAWRRR
jgi:hypothetical protein